MLKTTSPSVSPVSADRSASKESFHRPAPAPRRDANQLPRGANRLLIPDNRCICRDARVYLLDPRESAADKLPDCIFTCRLDRRAASADRDMLLIPYQTRFTLKSLPLVTLALILVNAVVYFVFQSGDRQAYARAADYYFSSQLAQIELPRYATYLDRRTDRGSLQVLRMIRAGARPEQSIRLILAMENDREFMRDLREGAVVPSSDPAYAAWRDQRAQFDALLGRVFTERFALESGVGGAAGAALRLITYQFLHGDAVHWLGNMIVLLLAGPFAEAALGRFRFLIAFIASGVFAGALHMLVSDQPLIGASGSISGAMAMVAVLYGTRKVPVFYWLFVYFNTARIPALLLLPVWLANRSCAVGVVARGAGVVRRAYRRLPCRSRSGVAAAPEGRQKS